MPSLNKPALDRHFMGDPDKRLLRHIFTYSADLKANLSGPYPCNPKLRLTLAFTHSRFQRLGTHRFMWKHPYIDFAFAMQKVSCSNSAGLDVPRGYPARFQSLQAVFAERNVVAPRSIALHFASLALTVLNSLRHHCHFLDLCKNYTYQITFYR
jgi:hypothetical protein